MVYFAAGASGFIAIAQDFWVKQALNLTPINLAVIGFWLTMPWTIKMVFGSLADSITIFGSARRSYILGGAGLIGASYLLLAGIAAKMPIVLGFGSPENLYFLAAMVGMIGYVIQDVIADAMSTEVVDRYDEDGSPRTPKEIEADLAYVQWIGRIFHLTAMALVAGIGGWLAAILQPQTMFLLALGIPVVSTSGALIVRLNTVPLTPVNWRVLGGGITFGIFVVALKWLDIPASEEIIFLVTLGTLAYLMAGVGLTRIIALTVIALFVFRASPDPGVGVTWWMIEKLDFDQSFFGTLRQMGVVLALIGLVIFQKYFTERPLVFVLTGLTIVGAVLNLPMIGVAYGIHDWLGVSARSVAIVDTALNAPFAMLLAVPILALIARTCVIGTAATQFALIASFINLSQSFAQLGTKYLNKIFVIQKGAYEMAGALDPSLIVDGNYQAVGPLLITCWVLGLVMPLSAIWFILPKSEKV